MTSLHLKTPLEKEAPRSDTVENVQALRGIAALMVVWAHIKFPLDKLCPGADRYPLVQTGHGAMGVDLFFIISGYVICLAASKRHHHPYEFLLARIARVSPLYLVYVLLFLLAKELFHGASDSLRSIWNGIFYLPLFDWKEYSQPPGGVGWSLSFELWFYLVFALLLHLGTPKKVAFFLPIIFSVGAVLMIPYHGDWYFPRFMFHPFVLEFAFGCVVFNTQRLVTRNLSWFLLAAGILYMIAFSRHAGLLPLHPLLLSDRLDLAWQRVLLWGFPSALIVAGLVGLERNDIYTLPQGLVWVGGISYSLYLSHQLTMEIVADVGQRIGLHSLAVIVLLVPVLCVFGAWLCWKCIEKPLTVQAQRWAKKLSQTARPTEATPVQA
jgi:peptidoglycan/LPS O-acetylase OafA/YrhL